MNTFMFQAALICEPCGLAFKEAHVKPAHVDEDDESSYDSDVWPKGPYRGEDEESDHPDHCDHCGVFLENRLTDDGIAHVIEALISGDGDKAVLVEWGDHYLVDGEVLGLDEDGFVLQWEDSAVKYTDLTPADYVDQVWHFHSDEEARIALGPRPVPPDPRQMDLFSGQGLGA